MTPDDRQVIRELVDARGCGPVIFPGHPPSSNLLTSVAISLWRESSSAVWYRRASVFTAGRPEDWAVPTGRNVQTRWVEFAPVAGGGAK